MVGKRFFFLEDGGAENLGLRFQGFVASAAARAFDQVISSGVFAIPGQLAFGDPQDRELVDMLHAVGWTHEVNLFLRARRALNNNTPVKLLEMPSTSPISA